jgi:hypothetical protein
MFRQTIALLAVGVLLSAVGCGSGLSSAEGVVTLDGSPVEGATVTFVPASGEGMSASGQTDSNGKFRLSTSGKPGAKAGDYKVTVIKTKAVTGGESIKDKQGTDYTKFMQEKSGAPPKPGGGGPGGGGPGGMVGRPPMPMPGKGAGPPGAGAKSELPAIYASGNTTPITQKIPAGGTIKIELDSKSK